MSKNNEIFKIETYDDIKAIANDYVTRFLTNLIESKDEK